MSTTVDTRELIALERRFGTLPAAVARDGAHRLTVLVNRGVAVAQRETPVDTRRAQGSIRGKIVETPTGVEGSWGSALPYFRAIEDGRRANKPMPPKGSLLGWLLRHGIPASAEYPIRRAIARRGIPAKRPLFKSRQALGRQIKAEMRGLSGTVRATLKGRA